jgi:hypothetical protein
MKSGQVLTDRRYKWFEPEYWRFGEAAGAEGQINYMRHASGQIYGLSGPVAKYIGRNGPILHRFANEDVTLGAWLVGLEITHVDERRMCCDSAEKCNAQVSLGVLGNVKSTLLPDIALAAAFKPCHVCCTDASSLPALIIPRQQADCLQVQLGFVMLALRRCQHRCMKPKMVSC